MSENACNLGSKDGITIATKPTPNDSVLIHVNPDYKFLGFFEL
jgi:hypothetical protein